MHVVDTQNEEVNIVYTTGIRVKLYLSFLDSAEELISSGNIYQFWKCLLGFQTISRLILDRIPLILCIVLCVQEDNCLLLPDYSKEMLLIFGEDALVWVAFQYG
jgi:hypothetical protein